MKNLFKELNNLKLGIFIILIISIILSIVLAKIELYTKSLLTTNIIPFIIFFITIAVSMLSAYNTKDKINNISDNSKKKLIISRYFIYVIFVIIGIILGLIINIIFFKFLNLLDTEIKEQIVNCISYSIIVSFLLRFFYYTL